MSESTGVAGTRKKNRIFLNSANDRALAGLPLIGPDIAREMIRRRPFKSWEDFKQALGFDQDMIALFCKAGATLRAGSARPKVQGVKRSVRKTETRSPKRGKRRHEAVMEIVVPAP
jgi:hypothetical protein